MVNSLDIEKLERAVKGVYSNVAENPHDEFHFEMGRTLAERLGYPSAELDRIPDESIDSFAGVGFHFDLAALEVGETVLDMGSGSGMDVFFAALQVGDAGSVIGLDMTDRQLRKARKLRDNAGFTNVSFEKGYIEELPFENDQFDVIISNGVINLSPDKTDVFGEAYRVLKPDGRLAVSDILSEKEMPQSIKTDADLWAACIGGAEQIDSYSAMLENSGFEIVERRDNEQYEFVSDQAANACRKYGVKSVSLLARKI